MKTSRSTLLAACLLMLGGLTALTGCGGSTHTTTVTKRVRVRVRAHPGQNHRPSVNGPPISQEKFEVRQFQRNGPKELRVVATCLASAGFGRPAVHSHGDYEGTGRPYVSTGVKTTNGSYGVAIFPKAKDAFVWAFQQSTGPGEYALHASYYGRVALASDALKGNGGIAERGDESHAYYAERSAIAACAFSIPAAKGQPAFVA